MLFTGNSAVCSHRINNIRLAKTVTHLYNEIVGYMHSESKIPNKKPR